MATDSYDQNIIHTEDGETVHIVRDEDAQNPRTEWENAGTMVCFHNRMTLGDKHSFSCIDDFQNFIDEEYPPVVLPLFLMDHSGLSIRTRAFSCPWDSGQVGWIYIDNAKFKQEFGSATRENIAKAVKLLEAEVSTYNDYLGGNVWGFIKYDDQKNVIDSCFGFYGDNFAENGLNEAAGI